MKLTESELRHIVKQVIKESLSEIQLYHGTQADFDTFDTAYLSTGWGQQAHGYGFYLIDNYDAAKDYSCGGQVMQVEVPDGKYLTDKSISMRDKQRIAQKFFNYVTQETEYGKESYPDEETRKDFWDYEVSYVLHCSSGDYVYGTLASICGDTKEVSNFLHDKCGYTGLIVHDKPTHDTPLMKIYVIFNPNDIKIIKKNV